MISVSHSPTGYIQHFIAMRFSRNGYNSDDIAQSEYSQVPEITSIQMETLTLSSQFHLYF